MLRKWGFTQHHFHQIIINMFKNFTTYINRKARFRLSRESGAGFTLIEVVFVLVIFLIIVGAAVDIFVSIIQHQKRILVEQELLNQTSYVTEYVSKALRMAVKSKNATCLTNRGYFYELTHCPNGTLEACNGIKFINQSDNDACLEFFLDDTTDPLNPVFSQIKNGGPAQNLLSDIFDINRVKFVINGNQALHATTSSDLVQPRVTMLFDVITKESKNPQQKIIQTTVSIRNLNAP